VTYVIVGMACFAAGCLLTRRAVMPRKWHIGHRVVNDVYEVIVKRRGGERRVVRSVDFLWDDARFDRVLAQARGEARNKANALNAHERLEREWNGKK